MNDENVELLPEMPLTLSRLDMSLYPLDGAVEDRRFLTEDMRFLMVFHATVHVLSMCLVFNRTQIAFL